MHGVVQMRITGTESGPFSSKVRSGQSCEQRTLSFMMKVWAAGTVANSTDAVSGSLVSSTLSVPSLGPGKGKPTSFPSELDEGRMQPSIVQLPVLERVMLVVRERCAYLAEAPASR